MTQAFKGWLGGKQMCTDEVLVLELESRKLFGF